MTPVSESQLVAALTLLVVALFIGTGMVSARWRRGMQRTAIGLYVAVLALVLAAIALWAARGFG